MAAASHPIRALVRGLLCLALAHTGLPAAVAAQSLGDVAQKEKARREKAKGRPPRVYTDEDLPKSAAQASGEAAPDAAATNPSESSRASEGGGEAPADERASEDTSGGGGGIDGRAAQAQAALSAAQAQAAAADAEVERLKQFLNPMSTFFITDPYQIIKVQSDLTEAQGQAAAARQEVAAAQKAMDEAVEEARRAGVRLPK